MPHQATEPLLAILRPCAAMFAGALLRRDAGPLEDSSVTLGVCLVDRIELAWRGRCRDRSLRKQFLLYVRHLKNLGYVLAHLREDRFWRSGRREHAKPRLIFIIRQRLRDGRHLG